MRISNEIKFFLKDNFGKLIPEAKLYLFGSRVDDSLKGGDIDILVLSNEYIDKNKIRKIRIDFFRKFGWQKIDIVNFKFNDDNVFKRLVENTAIEL